MAPSDSGADSIVHGLPLAAEPSLGALTLGGYLREVTTRFAGREAVVMHEHGAVTRWSYAELWAQANAVARALRAAGAGKDTRVGILMTNRPEWPAGVFGTALAGGVAVCLSTFSTIDELDYLLRSSCVSILLFEARVAGKSFADMLVALEPAMAATQPDALISISYPFLRRLVAVGTVQASGAIETWDAFLAAGDAIRPALIDAAASAVRPHEAGAILYSSGSTGHPKGIVNTHRGICIQLWRWRRMFGLAEETRAWASNGFFWSGNFATVLGATLSTGGCLVLQSTFDPVAALALIEAERVNYPVAWPHQAQQMREAANWASVDLSALRYVDVGSPLAQHPTVRTDWREPVCTYGNTETFTVATCLPNSSPDNVAGRSNGAVQVGMAVKIVDPETGVTLPRGDPGEIAVKGVTLMLGYVGIDPLETFDADGFLRTGDGGRLDDEGLLHWTGRLGDMIKTGGANVSPLEVDAVLARLPGVKVARTVGVPHPTLGEMVVGCIVPEPGTTPDEEAIRGLMKRSLSSYKVPRRILFLGEDELTLTGTAKIKLSELRRLASARLETETA